MAGCSCNGVIANTGYPNGVKPFGVPTGKILVPILAADGTRNGLDLEAGDFGQQLLDLLNNPDPTKRGYIFTDLKNVTSEQADPTYETADNGERFKVRDGIRTVKYATWGVNEQYFAKAKDVCTHFGVYDIDVCGSVRGQKDTTLGVMLYPREVNLGSFNAMWHDATNDAVSKVTFEFDYSFTTNDANSWMLTLADFGDVNPNFLRGMLDVLFTITPATATTLTVVATFAYGNANTLLPFKGLTAGMLTAYNVTEDASITISSVSQSDTTPGTYTVTIPAQTTNDNAWLKAFNAATGNYLNGFESAKTSFVCL